MRMKMYDNGEAAKRVADGLDEWSDRFTPESPTHCGNWRGPIDYDYQIELTAESIFEDYPSVVLIVTETGRRFERSR